MSSGYVMESPSEGQRLLAKEEANPSRRRLLETGLREGMQAADLGCGSGAVLSIMSEIVGASGRVVGIDPSSARLSEAAALARAAPNVELAEAALPNTGLPALTFDYVWCQYVLEYLRDPLPAILEMKRISRPGGRVVASEIDGHGLLNWPFPDAVRDGAERLGRALARTGFDLFAGRKMFHHFRRSGFADVRVRIEPLYVAAGRAADQILEDWRLRFEALAPLAQAEFGSRDAYDRFARDYMKLLEDPDALKYALILTTEATAV